MLRTDTRRRIARITAGCLMMGWGIAWASVSAATPDLIGLPWAQVAVGALIAAWGGATATLGRYLTAAYDNRPFFWRAEVVHDLGVSVTVGGGAYFAGWSYQTPPALLGLMLLLLGYAGTRALGAAVERLLSSLADRRNGGGQ